LLDLGGRGCQTVLSDSTSRAFEGQCYDLIVVPVDLSTRDNKSARETVLVADIACLSNDITVHGQLLLVRRIVRRTNV
jgi:hypothetical protein